jgi:hypothetical protein
MHAALPTLDRMGLASMAALARCNLGMAERALGRLAEAEASESDAVRAFAAQNDRRMEGASRNNLAIVLADRADLDGAEREARAAVSLLAGNGPARAYALSTLSRVLLARGNVEEALAAANEAMIDALGGIEEGESAVLLAHAEALFAHGEAGAAAMAIARARARLLTRAERIDDQARRASFLSRVPDNARMLALSRAWTGAG